MSERTLFTISEAGRSTTKIRAPGRTRTFIRIRNQRILRVTLLHHGSGRPSSKKLALEGLEPPRCDRPGRAGMEEATARQRLTHHNAPRPGRERETALELRRLTYADAASTKGEDWGAPDVSDTWYVRS